MRIALLLAGYPALTITNPVPRQRSVNALLPHPVVRHNPCRLPGHIDRESVPLVTIPCDFRRRGAPVDQRSESAPCVPDPFRFVCLMPRQPSLFRVLLALMITRFLKRPGYVPVPILAAEFFNTFPRAAGEIVAYIPPTE